MWGSYFWLDMTRLYTQWLQVFQRKDRFSHYQNLTSLSAFGSILKIFGGNRCRLMWGSYFWLDMIQLYTHWLPSYQQKDRFSHYQNSTSLSAFGSILKFFGGNRVGKCEGRTFGWIWQDYVHDGYDRTNEKLDSHITENLMSLSAFGSIFWKFLGTDVG